jgi:hypothetical protein
VWKQPGTAPLEGDRNEISGHGSKRQEAWILSKSCLLGQNQALSTLGEAKAKGVTNPKFEFLNIFNRIGEKMETFL